MSLFSEIMNDMNSNDGRFNDFYDDFYWYINSMEKLFDENLKDFLKYIIGNSTKETIRITKKFSPVVYDVTEIPFSRISYTTGGGTLYYTDGEKFWSSHRFSEKDKSFYRIRYGKAVEGSYYLIERSQYVRIAIESIGDAGVIKSRLEKGRDNKLTESERASLYDSIEKYLSVPAESRVKSYMQSIFMIL